MNKFELTSAYQPTGDQPEAIAQLTEGVHEGLPAQTLLGVTGSGKTFTIANVIANINKPTLILSHNKTLAAQLYSEFKGFFPNNAVEYYVSYYDYYQPEAYLPSSDTYIEKDLAINDEIDKLRLAATSALLSGRKDVVVVSSVSCIYGMGNPADFYNNVIEVQQGKNFSRNVFLRRLVDSLYVRNDIDLNRGNFRVKGDTVDIYLAYADNLLRVTFWGDEVDSIEEVDPMSGVTVAKFDAYKIYPANLFMTTKEATLRAIHEIEDDLHKQVQWFENEGRPFEAKRLQERVTYDMEMIRELGHCSGIENYSRYFDGRAAGTRPYCLLDFFPEDFLIVIDESHNVLSYPKLYHNLKAAIKEVCTEARNPNIFYDDCPIPGEEMLRIVENREFSRLPSHMGNVAQEALETLLHTRDGQLCDIMIDKAALEAIRKAGKESGEPIIENYADTMVAIADIKIAVRSRKTGKSADFMRSAMAECDGVNVEQLIRAALAGEDEIAQYLEGTAYAKGAQALRESASAFERWCDNRMIEMLKPQKYEAFSVGPLLGYLIARETEIKTVRIILTGKQNGFSDEAIRERIREMYV